jgi:hypothetical protein
LNGWTGLVNDELIASKRAQQTSRPSGVVFGQLKFLDGPYYEIGNYQHRHPNR